MVVVAEVCTAVGIEAWPSSRAGRSFFLFEWEESKGVFRPNDRPTADAPTTVAVAQSCVTRMRQSWHSVRLGCEVYRGETGKPPPLSEVRAASASRQVKTKQGPPLMRSRVDGTEETQRSYRWNSFHSRSRPSHRGELTRRSARDDTVSIMAFKVPGNHGSRAARRTDGGMEGLNQTPRRCAASRGKAEEGRLKHPQRAEAERWSFVEEADGGLRKSTTCCFWDLRTGLPSRLGISEMSPMNIGLKAACRNITRSQHRPHASLAAS